MEQYIVTGMSCAACQARVEKAVAKVPGVDTVSVTTGMSHSWCEIYFENLGWIAFDATPGYDSDYYWATR